MKFDRACSSFGKFLKSLFLILILMALGQSVFAATEKAQDQCIRRLTNDGALDSLSTSLDTTTLNIRDFDRDHVARAIAFIRETLALKGCTKSAVDFSKGPTARAKSLCRELVKDSPHTESCYIETNLGYFFVTQDMLTTVHVVFNRWD